MLHSQDITERKQIEAALQERVKELTGLYAVSREIQASHDLATLCQRVLAHIVPAMQFPDITAPVIELNGQRFASAKYAETLSHALHATIKGKKKEQGHIWVYYTEERPFLIPEEQNLLNGMAEALGLWLENKQAKHALQKSVERFSSITAQMIDMVFITDTQGIITYVSPAAENIFGFTQEEMQGHPFTEFLAKTDIAKAMAAFNRAVSNGQVNQSLKLRMKHKDGSIFMGELKGKPYHHQEEVSMIGLIRHVMECQ